MQKSQFQNPKLTSQVRHDLGAQNETIALRYVVQIPSFKFDELSQAVREQTVDAPLHRQGSDSFFTEGQGEQVGNVADEMNF